jgi:hypothetical protein
VVYEEEFPKDFKVPREIIQYVKQGLLEDTSWHNDESPSFGTRLADGTLLRLWVGHPNLHRREGAPRYGLYVQEDFGDPADETIMETDDVEEVLFHMLNVIERRGKGGPRFRLLGR